MKRWTWNNYHATRSFNELARVIHLTVLVSCTFIRTSYFHCASCTCRWYALDCALHTLNAVKIFHFYGIDLGYKFGVASPSSCCRFLEQKYRDPALSHRNIYFLSILFLVCTNAFQNGLDKSVTVLQLHR